MRRRDEEEWRTTTQHDDNDAGTRAYVGVLCGAHNYIFNFFCVRRRDGGAGPAAAAKASNSTDCSGIALGGILLTGAMGPAGGIRAAAGRGRGNGGGMREEGGKTAAPTNNTISTPRPAPAQPDASRQKVPVAACCRRCCAPRRRYHILRLQANTSAGAAGASNKQDILIILARGNRMPAPHHHQPLSQQSACNTA